MLALAILGLVMTTPLHGYEIRKHLSEVMGISGPISYGSLYPTLAKLHRQGLISADNITRIPPTRTSFQSTGSLSGDIALSAHQTPRTGLLSARKNKKVYSITEKGMIAFEEKLQKSCIDQADDDRVFLVHLSFLDFMNDSLKETFISHRKKVLDDRRERIASTSNDSLNQWRDIERVHLDNQIDFLNTLHTTLVSTKGAS